jgi:hypothetical protein
MGAGGRADEAAGAYAMSEAGGTEPAAFVPDAADDCWAAGIRIRAAPRSARRYGCVRRPAGQHVVPGVVQDLVVRDEVDLDVVAAQRPYRFPRFQGRESDVLVVQVLF